MYKKYLSVILSIMFLSVMSSSFVLAQSPSNEDKNNKQEIEIKHDDMRVFDGFMKDRFEKKLLAAALDLTDEQQARIASIHKQVRPEMIGLLKDLKTKRAALDQALFSETLNDNIVNQKSKELLDTQSQLLALRIKIQSQIRQVLTPEQIRKFAELRQDMPKHHTKMFNKKI